MTQEAGQWIRQALGQEAPAEEFHQARWCPPLQRPCPRWRHPPPLGPGRGRQVKGGTPLWDGRRARPPGGNGPFCSGLRTQGSADVPRTPWGRAWMVVATAFPPPLRCRSSAWKSSLTGGGSQVRRCGDHTGRETTQAPPSAADASTGPAGRANDRLQLRRFAAQRASSVLHGAAARTRNHGTTQSRFGRLRVAVLVGGCAPFCVVGA